MIDLKNDYIISILMGIIGIILLYSYNLSKENKENKENKLTNSYYICVFVLLSRL